MPFRFESLEIWHRARRFSMQIHVITGRFPKRELYALADQMNRASNATSLLIAEGAGLDTQRLFSHRLSLAVGETFEVVAGAFLALDRAYITEREHAEIYESGDALARKISSFRNGIS
jgi:four helix bundle protein